MAVLREKSEKTVRVLLQKAGMVEMTLLRREK
jgi:hypothetical protein